jgi:hypothetical protein
MPLAENLFARLRALDLEVGEAIFPGQAPAGTLAPYLVWQTVSTRPDVTHDAASASGLHLVQLSCIADSYAAARDLATALVAGLDSVTLAGGEVCLSCTEHDGFSEATDQFLRHVEAEFFVPAAA